MLNKVMFYDSITTDIVNVALARVVELCHIYNSINTGKVNVVLTCDVK